jgi:neutral ceramidase
VSLCCGTAVADITPPPGLPMGGYAARAGTATGTLDGLTCRAVAFADGEACVVLVILDLLCLSEPWAGTLRRRIAACAHCPPAHVLLAATHTHAGPAVFRSALAVTAELTAYESRLADTVLDTVARARAATQSVELGFGGAPVAGVSSNRTAAARHADHTVRVLVARVAGGACAAVVAVYGCHPTVLPPANLNYSRDLFGAAVDSAERLLGARVLLFNGAAADVSTRFTRRGQDANEVARHGQLVGAAIAAAARDARPIAAAAVRGRWDELTVRLRPLPDAAVAQQRVAAASERLQAARAGAPSPGERRRAAAELEGALAQLFLATQGGAPGLLGRAPVTAPLQLLRIGDASILGVPGELFSAMGERICASRRRPTLLVGYANDYLGYLVDPEAVATDGYETLSAFIDPASVQSLAEWLMEIDREDTSMPCESVR